MTREQAIKAVGIEWVEKVEKESCDFTNRVTSGTEWDGFDEFSSSVDFNKGEYVDFETGSYCSIVAYYYQKSEDVNKTQDLGSLVWEVDHYELY